MPEYSEMIRITDQEALAMIRELADEDLRSMGSEVAWLIRAEYAKRKGQKGHCSDEQGETEMTEATTE